MVILDSTVVTIALPTIQNSLQFSVTDLSWVLNAYTLALGGLPGQMTQLRQRIIPGALAVLITFAVLAMTAAARWTTTAGT